MRRLLATMCVLLGAALGLASHAMGSVTIDRFSFTGAERTACSGEVIKLDGDLQLVTRVTEHEKGVLLFGQTFTMTLRGTSATGARYLGSEVSTVQSLATADNFTLVHHTSKSRVTLRRLGEDGTSDDLRVLILFQETLNAKGEVVEAHWNIQVECS
jgi:hypothetical protein